MIPWFTVVVVAVACAAGLLCIALGLFGKKPADITNGATALVELLLVIQLVISLVSPLAGSYPTGSGLEFWAYLVSVVLVPPLAVLWGLIERNKWSTVVLGVACLAAAVMVYRMHQIWFVQIA